MKGIYIETIKKHIGMRNEIYDLDGRKIKEHLPLILGIA